MKILYYMALKSMIKHKEDLNLTNKQKSQIESLLLKVGGKDAESRKH